MRSLTRRQWAVLAGVFAGAALIAVSLTLFRRQPTAESRDAPSAMEDMAGMPGMDMQQRGTIQLSAAQIRQFGVTFGGVEQRMLTKDLRVPATVVPDETRTVQVSLKFGGFIERLDVNVTGQYVRRGQPLMELYSPEVFAAMQELLVAQRLESAGAATVPGLSSPPASLVATARRRLELLGVALSDVEIALQRGEPPRTVRIYAPAGGIVAERMVTEGQAVRAGETLYTISDLSSVWVNAEVRETDAAHLRSGMLAEVELASMPGRPFRGFVSYVYPTLDVRTRTVTARVTVANAGGQLRPGMFATVRLRSPGRLLLSVPTAAVIHTGERTLVFVDMGDGRIHPVAITTGESTSDFTEVLAGLEPGQRVVTSAQYLLDSESNLTDVMRSMIGQGSAGMTEMQDMPGMDMGGQPSDKGARVRP